MESSTIEPSSDEISGDAAGDILSRFTAINYTQQKKRSPRQNIAVVVPKVPNPEDYDFLPGHSEVDEVIEKAENRGPKIYTTRLASGDIERISYDRLHTLRNGKAALSEFLEAQSSKSRPKRLQRGQSSSRPSRNRASRHHDGYAKSTTTSLSSDEDLPRRNTRLRQRNLRSVNSADTSSRRRSNRISSARIESSIASDEESAIPSDDYSNGIVGRRPRRGRPKRGPRRASPKLRTGVRSSQRNVNKNVAELLEDDISEVDDHQRGPKYSGAKEIFAELPKNDPFRLRHRQTCDACLLLDDDEDKGPLIFCTGCTNSYHKQCLGPRIQREHLVTKVGDKDFVLQCRRCLGVAHTKDQLSPHQGYCSQCKEPSPLARPFRSRLTARQEQQLRDENGGVDPIIKVDRSLLKNVDNVMFRCSFCERAWHVGHLKPKSNAVVSSVDENVSDLRFREYSRKWTCEDCANMPGEIESLVAWRPVDLETFVPGYTSDMIEEIAKEYLIKWRKHSYFKTTWMPGPWVWSVTSGSMRKAFQRSPKNGRPRMTAEDAIPEEFLQVDIVLDVRYSNIVSNRTYEIDIARSKEVEKMYVKYKGLPYEDAVWESIPSPRETDRWHSYQTAYEDWVLGHYIHVPKPGNLKKHLSHVRSQDFASRFVKNSQPARLTGGQIMGYQLDGLNWLYYMWYKQQNAILADEMGLGKTIQIIALLATLVEDHKCWPFLVVVPNSTCPNWRREVKKWAPSLRAVTYYGSSTARKIAHDYEMFPSGGSDLRCHIVVTSYETMADEKARRIFNNIHWAGLIVDEGQRLKNDQNQLYQTLSKISFPFKVLLTGTPLQNNTRELFNLLQFLDPSKDAEALELQYAELTKEHVAELHEMIRPFFLRRTKAQVLTFLPPIAQIIVPVSMTVLQKKLYKSILAKNPQLIKAIFNSSENHSLKQSERHNLNNILVQLRKCLCHPFVYSKAIEERGLSAAVSHRNLVEASSKLQLLEPLLTKLHQRGHRVLIFSQFLDNLDVVEDFLDGLGLLHRRLDGNMSSLQKQKQIDEYNAPNSPYFAFLLSTRSGGVGINLASADTVIIMDPDFNPHQDIQALSRAHRIGQQKKVLVFQLMTKDTVEEKIMQIGRKKMALDHVLIERMDTDDVDDVDLEAILRHGADALFDEEGQSDIRYDDESTERLLDRTHLENTRIGDDASAESQFSFARVWVNDSATLQDRLASPERANPPSATVWENILKERERAAAEEAKARMETLGRGKRKRQVNSTFVVISPFDCANGARPSTTLSNTPVTFKNMSNPRHVTEHSPTPKVMPNFVHPRKSPNSMAIQMELPMNRPNPLRIKIFPL